MNVFELSRNFWDWTFQNPDKIKPVHCAVYFFAIEHCNRLGWKEKFGFPTSMVMEAIGVRSYNTYKKTLEDLVEWGFLKMIEKSKNQFSANIIALSKFNKAVDKALDKALIKHSTKQVKSTEQSNDSIDIQLNNNTIEQENNNTNRKFIFLKSLIEYGFEKKMVEEWMKVRRTKKATNTETAFKKFIKEIEKTNYDKNKILKICIEKDWKGFNASWLSDSDKSSMETQNSNSNEPIITFRDNVNPTQRKLPKSEFLKIQKQGKAGGYIYEIISEE